MRSKWRVFRAMSWNERKVALLAALGLPTVAAWLRIASLARIQTVLRRGFRPGDRDPDRQETIKAVVSKVADRHPYRANCLERSLVLWWLLGRSGIVSEVRFGVRPAPDGGPPDFHSWLEVDGVVLNDRSDIGSEFIPFDQPIGAVPRNLV